MEQQTSRSVSVVQVRSTEECPWRQRDCKGCEDRNITGEAGTTCYITKACKAARVRAELLEKSGLVGSDIRQTFSCAAMDKYTRRLYEYLQQEWDREQWLYIYSVRDANSVNPTGNGTGKSYTANAIANLLIDAEISVLVCREVDMAAQLQATFAERSGESEYALMGRFKGVPVLIVQDFGKQGCKSEWWPMKLYDIIDQRVIGNKTTIFTSNHDVTSLRVMEERFGDNHGPAIRSRLLGMCGKNQNIWRLDGPDRRLVIANRG